MYNSQSMTLAESFGALLKERGLYCAVAESCTGGGLAAAITDISGSSMWFDRGFITYSNQAKQEMLNVPENVLLTDGAVSEATVCAMARGVLLHSAAQVSIAISGIAGPLGGSPDKPVGTVWIAVAIKGVVVAVSHIFSGDRHEIREQAVVYALQHAIEALCR